MSKAEHSLNSGLREKIIEHLFIGDLLRCLWLRGVHDVDVLKAKVDRAGYDLVLAAGGVMRHVQLKSSFLGAKTSRTKAHTDLAQKSSGCVIWIWFDPETMKLGPFGWFGGEPGKPLPPLGDHVAKHTKGNKDGIKQERPDVRVLAKGQFTELSAMEDVIEALFGDITNS